MKTFGATTLFTDDGTIVTEDIHQIAIKITEAESKTIYNDHETKLVRIEIGMAIRQIAAVHGTTMTEAISNMDLCKSINRAEKTFLKYARIAGSASMVDLANNQQVSLSVLDEIAASKKPVISHDRTKFVHRICDEVVAVCDKNLEEEGLPKDGSGRLRGLGITRNEAVGIIRRIQIEMGVETKSTSKDEKERKESKEKKDGTRANQLSLQLVHLLRLMFLSTEKRTAWLELHGLELSDVGSTMLSIQAELVELGAITTNAEDLDPLAVDGLTRKLEAVA